MAFFKPDEYLSSVLRIDPQDLVARGFTALLLDIDNTLVPRGTTQVPPPVRDWIARCKASGLHLCLLSNNWHKTVFGYAATLELPLVYKAMKPAPFAFLRALGKIDEKTGHAVVVGDQLMTDILGAHLCGGMHAILVEPQSQIDLKHTLLLRKIERWFLRGCRPSE
jgi:HAD superfamily phosphatase (TIGR01668 family)